MTRPILFATGLCRIYPSARPVIALDHVDLTITGGEIVGIMGPSGSGKSTLLNLIGLLDRPTSGSLEIEGNRVEGMDERARTRLRADWLGFVFQRFHLIGYLTAIENVEMGLAFRGLTHGERRSKAARALGAVGLGDRLEHRPAELSGGEQQRVAVARALAPEPKLMIADEPTGNLDRASGDAVIDTFIGFAAGGGAVVVATHDPVVATRCTRVITLRDGAIEP